MNMFLSGPAVGDLEAIAEHALATQPSKAQALIKQLHNSIGKLGVQCEQRLSSKAEIEEVGRIVSGGYALHYEVNNQRLIISRILRRHITLSELS
jgi:plasmid stabilization system protein ParE